MDLLLIWINLHCGWFLLKHKIKPKFEGAEKPQHFEVEEWDEELGIFDAVKNHARIKEILDEYGV